MVAEDGPDLFISFDLFVNVCFGNQEEIALKKIGVLFGMENTFPGALVE